MRASPVTPGSERPGRSSVYEASVGRRFADGRFALRGGQMWLQNLGGLGSVGGVLGEYRARTSTPLGRPRFGVFTGLEPEILDAAYVERGQKDWRLRRLRRKPAGGGTRSAMSTSVTRG